MIFTASLLANLAAKSFVLAGVTLVMLRITRTRAPAERSIIAHVGLLSLLLLPLGSLMLPAWAPLPEALSFPASDLPVAGRPPVRELTQSLSDPAQIAPVGSAAAQASVGLKLEQLIVWLYALPLAAIAGMMALAVLRLFAMRQRAEVLVDGPWLSALAGAQRRMGYKHGTALLVSEELRSPISWGVMPPTILLDPRAVAAVDDAEAIIAHELAHVTRFDWVKLLIARLACALFWFNPLVWLLARESHQLREEAADDTVLLTQITGPDYAALLVNAARHDNNAVLIAAHGVAPGESSLRRRVTRALDQEVRRGPVRAGWGTLSLITMGLVAGPLAALTTTVDRPSTARAGVARPPAQLAQGQAAAVPRAAHARTLSADDLVAMRAVGVEPEDLGRWQSAKGEIDPDSAIAAKALEVGPDYIGAMRSVFPGAELDELIEARAVGVDPAYAQAMRTLGPGIALDDVIAARAVGLSPAYAQEMRRFFPGADIDSLVAMRAVGVTSDYVRAMRGAGSAIATPDDAIEARVVAGPRPNTPPPPPPLPATGLRATRDGRTAVVGPDGLVASRRGPDGAVANARIETSSGSSGPPGEPDE